MRHPYPRYIPKEAVEFTAPTLPPGSAAYLYTKTPGDLPALLAYTGKSNKPAFHYCFTTEKQRAVKLAGWIESLEAWEAQKKERREKRKQPHGLKPGDILEGSWGYDQTNVEFYQVLEASPASNTITIREIAHEAVPGSGGFMSESRIAKPGDFIGPARKCLATLDYMNRPSCHITVSPNNPDGYRIYLKLWDGRPCYCSWYA